MLSSFDFVLAFSIESRGFLVIFPLSVVAMEGSFRLTSLVDISSFFPMCVGLSLLLNHVGLQGLEEDLLDVLS